MIKEIEILKKEEISLWWGFKKKILFCFFAVSRYFAIQP